MFSSCTRLQSAWLLMLGIVLFAAQGLAHEGHGNAPAGNRGSTTASASDQIERRATEA